MTDDAEILALPIELVQKKGYCFYWTINSREYLAEQFFAAHGYKKVDTIGWLKLSSKTGKESMSSPGCYFLHTMEFCHVGIKGDFKSVSAISKLRTHSNFICGPRREGSRKPTAIYELIEKFVPNGYYLDVFGRTWNDTIRRGWTSMGDQIKTEEYPVGIDLTMAQASSSSYGGG